MKIAVAQFNIDVRNKEKNQQKCEGFIAEAGKKKADIIIFPEMTLTGFSRNINRIGDENEETIEWFKEKADMHNINVCFGYVEKATSGKGKNNLSMVSPNGEELLRYTKMHPFSYGREHEFYEKGNKIDFFKIDDSTFSAFICYDLRFPEIFQIASKKAQVIIVIANWPEARREHWITLLRARAIENQCYVIGANIVGETNRIIYSGDSMVIDPLGNIIVASHKKEELIVADIDVEKISEIRNSFNIKVDRQEELYFELMKNKRLQ
ncbi:carbon-nitrogen family hydrolase [Clostridium aestuarii]|uniref:Carbon-nitrogen family hydrolase n=1 Tax=Clostridium aestuarii TaxID=338193 RepID=A0ABT4CZ04_9CLOT|nr:carbon-nitrogen family hydrolase [Clostridium aestuarii]MCY6484214.1 carbon-nitrogen family hydrolase [Clostridium aestuarii]